jgi:hypothetical protein
VAHCGRTSNTCLVPMTRHLGAMPEVPESAETEHARVIGACKISANDQAGAEACAGVGLAPPKDDLGERWKRPRVTQPTVPQVVHTESESSDRAGWRSCRESGRRILRSARGREALGASWMLVRRGKPESPLTVVDVVPYAPSAASAGAGPVLTSCRRLVR